jgi:hypothetical protein
VVILTEAEVEKEASGEKSSSNLESSEVDTSMANKETSEFTLARYADYSSNAEKATTADDIKLYLLVQRLLNETPLIDGYVFRLCLRNKINENLSTIHS